MFQVKNRVRLLQCTSWAFSLPTESLEEIGLVKKIIKQIISHSSKVLRFPNPEDKKLEVRNFIFLIMSKKNIFKM